MGTKAILDSFAEIGRQQWDMDRESYMAPSFVFGWVFRGAFGLGFARGFLGLVSGWFAFALAFPALVFVWLPERIPEH